MTPPATGPSLTEQDRAAERTIATARVIAALPEQVYAAFVSSERLARWWGPKGFRNTFQEQQVFHSLSEYEAERRLAVGANEENLDRLEAELARTSP